MTLAHPNFISRKLVRPAGRRWRGSTAIVLLASVALAAMAGCESSASSAAARSPQPVAAIRESFPAVSDAPTPEVPGKVSEIVKIREGDSLKISFPGAPMLDSLQQVRADGMVTLDSIGDVKVVGQSPNELEKVLSQKFASQLVSNEVSVVIVASSFDVYVTGSVLRPGKITTTKPITAFQAIMEAGYDPVNSNLEKVTLIRQVDRSKYTYIPLNLQLVLEGKDAEPFYLKPSDTLQVPKKISIF